MNARELAEKLDKFGAQNTYPILFERSANMLRQQADEIVRLKLEWQYMFDRIEQLQDFAIWMTGCGYDFTQHEHFIKCRDSLLKGEQLFK